MQISLRDLAKEFRKAPGYFILKKSFAEQAVLEPVDWDFFDERLDLHSTFTWRK